MHGCARISGSHQMAIQTAVLIETIKALSSDLRWWSCKNFSAQEHTEAVITHGESAAVFSWNGESLKEYWECILDALMYPEDGGKYQRPDPIFDDGVDMTLLVYEGNKAEDLFLKDWTIPDPSSTDNVEFKIVQTIIKRQLEGGETENWKKNSMRVWEFLRRPQREVTIYKPWRRHAHTTKSEKGRGQKQCVLNNTSQPDPSPSFWFFPPWYSHQYLRSSLWQKSPPQSSSFPPFPPSSSL